ncbi:MAG: hypothetical protein ACI37T_00630 [Candidatus Gastranaerophilaceae bacterium]
MDKFIHYYLPLAYDLCKKYAFTAFATAIIETVFFAVLKYNKKNFLPFVFSVNIVSNLLLNIWLSFTQHSVSDLRLGEFVVVLTEFLAFYSFLKPNSKNAAKLLLITIFSNLISYAAGVIFFTFVVK